MIEGFVIPKVTFKVREGDVVLEQGCSFDEGIWTEKTTDDYFKGKRVVLFSLQGHLLQLVHLHNFLVLKKIMKRLRTTA